MTNEESQQDLLEFEMALENWDWRIDRLFASQSAMKLISVGHLMTEWDLVNGRF